MFSINTFTHLLEYMRPCTVGLLDHWTIATINILYQDFYIFPMCNKTTWTIGLSDYWTIALFDIFYQYSYTLSRLRVSNRAIVQ